MKIRRPVDRAAVVDPLDAIAEWRAVATIHGVPHDLDVDPDDEGGVAEEARRAGTAGPEQPGTIATGTWL